MNTTKAFAKHIVNTGFENLDEKTVHRVKMRIIDAFGVTLIGAYGPGVDYARNIYKAYGGNDAATLITHGTKLPAPGAAYINSLMMRSFDFEAVQAEGENGKSGPGHISGSTVPAAIACTESAHKSGKDFITALALGDDMACRICMSQGFGLTDAFDNTGTTNGVAAAAIAAKLYELNEDQFVNAIGLAVNTIGGSMQNVNDCSLSFKIPMAHAAKNGVFCADLAKQGYDSLIDPLTGPRGFFELFCSVPDTSRMLEGLGDYYYGDIVIKPWSCCRATHKPNDAMLQATGGKTYKPEEIHSIIIKTAPGTVDFVGREYPFGNATQVNGAFNFRYTACTALLRGHVRPLSFTPDKLNDPDIGKLLDKLTVIAEPEEKGAKVTVNLANGQKLTGEVGAFAKGDIIHSEVTDDDIIRKYNANIRDAGTITEEKGKQLLDKLMNLEKEENIDEIIALTLKD